MECLNLSKQEFENNSTLFNKGFESEIFIYLCNNKETLIKKYFELDKLNPDKIELVNKLKSDILIKPSSFVKIDDELIGFAMRKYMKYYPISVLKQTLSDEKKYELLMKLKNEIINLREQGCIYADFNLNNIITDGKKIKLCDSVNVKIGEYNFDEISSTMRKYYDIKDTYEGIDCYMLNLLTIYLFNNIEYDDILERIETILTLMFNNKEYIDHRGITDNQECMSICYDMISDKVNSTGFLIDNITITKEKTI